MDRQSALGGVFWVIFIAYLVWLTFLTGYRIDFQWKIEVFSSWVFRGSRFFFNLATFMKHRNWYIGRHFFIFFIFIFFTEKLLKFSEKLQPSKNLRKWLQEGPKMTRTSMFFSTILVELAKMGPKRHVFDGSIFWQIFGIAKNMSQGATGNPGRANSEGPASEACKGRRECGGQSLNGWVSKVVSGGKYHHHFGSRQGGLLCS